MPKSDRPRLALRHTISLGVLVAVAATLLTPLLLAAGSDKLGHDFRAAYLPAAESVRETGSPYTAPDIPLAKGREPYVYPPLLAILLVPLTVVPRDAAVFLAFLASLASLLGALAVIGVRDARCYAVVLIWAPGWNALEMANVSAALSLLLALLWRYRDTLWRPALALGFAVSTKLFLWPMLVWAAATRRYMLAGWAVCIGLLLALSAWSAIGFEGFSSYPDQLARIPDEESYSIKAITTAVSGSAVLGDVVAAVLGGSLLAAAVLLGRRDDDFRAFTLAIAAGLALSPVVWQHYLVLLAVPLGLARPRFSAIWLLPVLLWASPRAANGVGLEPFLPAAVAVVLLAVILVRPESSSARDFAATRSLSRDR